MNANESKAPEITDKNQIALPVGMQHECLHSLTNIAYIRKHHSHRAKKNKNLCHDKLKT